MEVNMFALCLGVGVGICEFVIDNWKGAVKSPFHYFKDMGLVFICMTLLKILETL